MAIIMQISSIIFSLISLLTASVTGDAVYARERIRIATAGGLSIVPVWVMQNKGLLTKRGVTAEIVQIASSPVAIQAMLSGEVEAIVTSAATLVTSPPRRSRRHHDHVNNAHLSVGSDGYQKHRGCPSTQR
jgi:ABC-type nitrate/sulfonate/bicarbonate transport system substrate-binding protein